MTPIAKSMTKLSNPSIRISSAWEADLEGIPGQMVGNAFDYWPLPTSTQRPAGTRLVRQCGTSKPGGSIRLFAARDRVGENNAHQTSATEDVACACALPFISLPRDLHG